MMSKIKIKVFIKLNKLVFYKPYKKKFQSKTKFVLIILHFDSVHKIFKL